jgi:hypothetical protein
MKKCLLVFSVALLVLSVALPALADVEFLYGGQFRWRVDASNNVFDGTDKAGYYGNFQPNTSAVTSTGQFGKYYNANDNRFFFDQRLRLYFTFVGSKNLKVVTKFEMGDTVWGDPGTSASALGERTGPNGGGNIGADSTAIEIKNVYMEFNIPNTPTTAIIGIQTLTLLDSWIIDDDFSAAVLVSKLDPFRLTVGYIGGQNGADRKMGLSSSQIITTSGFNNQFLAYANQDLNIDDTFIALDYSCAPWKASIIGLWQAGHETNVSMEPATLGTPVTAFTGFTDTGFNPLASNIKSNNLFDIGANITYKTSSLLGYVNFVKNLGSVDYRIPVLNSVTGGTVNESNYTGYMIDAGLTYFCGPYTFNVGGFFTTGPSFSDTVADNGKGSTPQAANSSGIQTAGTSLLPFKGTTSTDVEWFTYPLGTSKYFSEIIGGGVLGDDLYVQRGYANGLSATKFSATSGVGAESTIYWRGMNVPTNLWTVTTGASWQVCPGTKLSASYWYFGTANAVPVAFDPSSLGVRGTATKYLMSSSIGNELDFYVDQKVVDNLMLTLVGAYLFADDAFCPLPYASTFSTSSTTGINAAKYTSPAAQNAFELGARLQWNF